MNSVSWLIYLADVLGNFKGVMTAFSVFGFAIIAGALFFCAVSADLNDWPADAWKWPLRYLPIPIVTTVIAVAVPSSTAMYLIAASELGETVVTSPEAKDMMGDLKTIIRKKLKEQLAEPAE